MLHVTAFVALFVAFVSVVLLAHVSNPVDAGAEAATAIWGQSATSGSFTAGPNDCCLDAQDLPGLTRPAH